MPKIRSMARQAAALLLLLSLWGAFQHSKALESVTVTLIPGQEEVGDGFRSAPDYRLDLKRSGRDRWMELGVFEQRQIGDGLVWRVPGSIGMLSLVELRLVEQDSAKDDVLERRPVDGLSFSGERYAFAFEERRDIKVGLEWFFETPLGALAALSLLITLLLSFLKLEID